MSKGPLVTRSELRKLKEQEDKQIFQREKEQEREYQITEKAIGKSFDKKRKKNKPITKSRASETEKTNERSKTLNLAIGVVVILLVIVFYAVFKL